jgi:uncharacterized protein (UPF0261 family)
MRTTVEENAELGSISAEKLNAATGPTALVLPLQGVSAIDAEGEDFYNPGADEAMFDSLRAAIDGDVVELIELDAHVNDETFAETLVETLEGYMRSAGLAPEPGTT